MKKRKTKITAHIVGGRKDVNASWNQTKQGIQEPTEIQGQKVLKIEGNRKFIGKQVVFPFVSNAILFQTEFSRPQGGQKGSQNSQPSLPNLSPHEQEPRAEERH